MPPTSLSYALMSEASPTLRRKVVRYVSWGALVLLLLVPAAAYIWILRNHRGPEEVRALVKETPVYPSFIQVTATESSKVDRASIIVTYNVPAHTVAFEDVKNFYSRELASKGWQPQPFRHKPLIGSGRPTEGQVIFSKGDYWITVEPGARITEYIVTYEWENPSY